MIHAGAPFTHWTHISRLTPANVSFRICVQRTLIDVTIRQSHPGSAAVGSLFVGIEYILFTIPLLDGAYNAWIWEARHAVQDSRRSASSDNRKF